MSTNVRSSDKRTGARPAYFVIGTDEKGADHVFRSRDSTVHVIGPDGRAQVEHLGTRSIDDWVEYVAPVRGWRDRDYYGGGLAWLADALAA